MHNLFNLYSFIFYYPKFKKDEEEKTYKYYK